MSPRVRVWVRRLDARTNLTTHSTYFRSDSCPAISYWSLDNGADICVVLSFFWPAFAPKGNDVRFVTTPGIERQESNQFPSISWEQVTMKTVQYHWQSAFALIQRGKEHVSCLRAVITVFQPLTTQKSRMGIHAPILCLRLLKLHTCGLDVSVTLLIVCRLRRAGASRGGFGGLCGFGRLGRLSGLRSLGGLVGRGAGDALRSASRAAARGASCSL